MHEVLLHRPERGGSSHLHAVMDDMNRILSEKGKVYTTFSDYDKKRYILATTSKDIHLQIGLFSINGLKHFCKLIDEEFNGSKCSELMLVHSANKGSSVLITKTIDNSDAAKYYLSPAH